jgi:hypothetical protein
MPINSFQAVLEECSADKAYRDTCSRITGGREYQPNFLDDLWRQLRFEKGRYLEKTDLDKLFAPENTHYGFYWKVPTGVNWGGPKVSFNESERGDNELAIKQWKHKIVQKVFTKLQSMEVTSVVLSCVYPDEFSVYSPPTLMILQVPPAPPIEHFLRYCDELEEWGKHFLGSKGVAFTDRAIWVFYESAYGHRPNTKVSSGYRKAYEEDEWIRQRHASNMLSPYFSRYQPLRQARFLLDIDVYLAATVAGCEFESRLKRLVNRDELQRTREIRRFQEQVLTTNPQSAKWGYLWSIIEYLAAKKGYTAQKDEMDEIRKLRNKAIHRDPGLTRVEAEKIVRVTASLPKQ